MTVTIAENGTSIRLSTGEILTVSLPEIPSTGYRWSLDAPVPPVLLTRGDEFVAPGAQVGAEGLRQLSFEAVKAGSGALELKMCREWEREVAPHERFRIHLTVE